MTDAFHGTSVFLCLTTLKLEFLFIIILKQTKKIFILEGQQSDFPPFWFWTQPADHVINTSQATAESLIVFFSKV